MYITKGKGIHVHNVHHAIGLMCPTVLTLHHYYMCLHVIYFICFFMVISAWWGCILGYHCVCVNAVCYWVTTVLPLYLPRLLLMTYVY